MSKFSGDPLLPRTNAEYKIKCDNYIGVALRSMCFYNPEGYIFGNIEIIHNDEYQLKKEYFEDILFKLIPIKQYEITDEILKKTYELNLNNTSEKNKNYSLEHKFNIPSYLITLRPGSKFHIKYSVIKSRCIDQIIRVVWNEGIFKCRTTGKIHPSNYLKTVCEKIISELNEVKEKLKLTDDLIHEKIFNMWKIKMENPIIIALIKNHIFEKHEEHIFIENKNNQLYHDKTVNFITKIDKKNFIKYIDEILNIFKNLKF